MVNRNRRKTKRQGPRRRSVISCPICDGQAIVADVNKSMADALGILPGSKYVCAGKFIYRSNNQDVQFAKCYGMPIESSLKKLQLTNKSGQPSLSKDEILMAYENACSMNPNYIDNVIQQDGFFEVVAAYIRKPEPEDSVGIYQSDDSFDPKSFMGDDS